VKEIYLGDWLGLEDINLVAKAKSTVAVITPYVHNTWMRQSGNAVAGKRTAYPVSSNAMLCCCPDAICTMFFPSSALMYTTQTLVRIIHANGKCPTWFLFNVKGCFISGRDALAGGTISELTFLCTPKGKD